MSWGKLLQPDLVLGGTVMDITPELLVEHNLKGLVFDVDETLVPIGQMEASEELRQRIVELRQVATLWLVSNNVNETRIGNIAKSLELPYIFFAAKPFPPETLASRVGDGFTGGSGGHGGRSPVYGCSGGKPHGHVYCVG